MSNEGFDAIYDTVGNFGRYQKCIYAVLWICAVISGMHAVASVFLLAEPDYHCRTDDVNSLPTVNDERCNITSVDGCHEYSYSGSLVDCQSGIEFEDTERWSDSAAVEFQMACTNSHTRVIAESMFFVGFLLGAGVSGFISDNYGRRTAILIGHLGTLIFGISSAFSSSWWLLTLLRCFTGLFSNLQYVAAYVYAIELVGSSYRSAIGIGIQAAFAFGYGILSPIAYLLPDWQHFLIAISSVSAIPIVAFIVIGESPRYLFTSRQFEATSKTLNIMSSRNGNSAKSDQLSAHALQILAANETSTVDRKYSIVDLFTNGRAMTLITLNCMFNWLVNSLAYYGLTLNAAALPTSLYLSNVLYALFEMPAYVGAAWLIEIPMFGRRGTYVTCMLLGGLSCLLSTLFAELSFCEKDASGRFQNPYIILALISSLLGKTFISATFAIIYNITAELFPTPVRASATGSCSMVSRIGGILAPVVLQMYSVASWSPGILFGTLSIVAGLLGRLLPETYGVPILMTIDEANAFYVNRNAHQRL